VVAVGPGGPGGFSDRLRALRLGAGLTQEALSERSGVSVGAIAALENGRRRRPRRDTVRMLAEGLRLAADARESLAAAARLQGPPHPSPGGAETAGAATPPEPRAGVPPGPVQHFVGRESELAWLHRHLQRVRHASVHGLGGIGKTQLLVRYVHERRAAYPDGVFWLRADQESALVGDLASLTWRLGLPEREERTQERQVEAVLRWLRRHDDWLIVLDNLECAAMDAMRRWLPSDLAGHLAVTSRTPMGPARLGLEPLPLRVATEFLLMRAERPDAAAAEAAAELLGCLPLALEQAAAYLESSGRDLASYVGLLRERLVELLGEGRAGDYPFTVATAWWPSFQRIAAECPAAADLLRLCAFLAPDDIPIALLQSGAGGLPEDLRSALDDEIALDRVIAALRRHSLGERHGDRLRVHRLVQAVVRESLSAGARRHWLDSAICLLLARLTPDASDHPDRWPLYGRLVPHVQVVARTAADEGTESGALATLLVNAAVYLIVRGESRLALPLTERSLRVRERLLGPDHPDTADSMGLLGGILMEHGRLDAARPLQERSLAIRERTLGPHHLDVAESLNNLGWLTLEQGDVEGACVLHERALHVRERNLGSDHPVVAQSLSNLGYARMSLGDLDAAADIHRRALAIREGVFGPNHPQTARSLSNLAMVVQRQGQLDAACVLHERVLGIRDRVLGPDHPLTAKARQRLATVRRAKGDVSTARALLDRAASAMERRYGPDHPIAVECRQALRDLPAEADVPGRNGSAH
jgi:transcriptional regulator with XRE-family HTH domain/Tfp pilus assembly protein PilF